MGAKENHARSDGHYSRVRRWASTRANRCAAVLAEAAEFSDAFDDFFGCSVGGGVGSPAAVACEGEELGACWVENFCYGGAGGGWTGGGHYWASDTVGYAVVEAGFDEDELDVVRCSALVELGEEKLAFHRCGVDFYFERELGHGQRGDAADEE